MKQVSRAIDLARTQSTPKRRNWRRSERILVPVTLTEEGGELVSWALTEGSLSGDAVTVIHVVEPCQPVATRSQVAKWERLKKEMLNFLSDLVTHCRTHYNVPHLSIIVEVVESKNVGEAIIAEARNLEATRVILGKQKARRLDLTPKRMTTMGRLCVQNLEPYCDVVIVRKSKVLVRRPGTAKLRRSLEALLLTNKTQESDDSEAADKGRKLVVGVFAVLDDERHLDPKKPPKWRYRSSLLSEKSRFLSYEPLDFPSANSKKNPSQDSSFSSGISSGGSETSPNSVLRTSSTPRGKSSFNAEKLDKGFPRSLTRSATISSFSPVSFQRHIAATPSGPRARSRCSPNSLESVPELPKLLAEAERRYDLIEPLLPAEDRIQDQIAALLLAEERIQDQNERVPLVREAEDKIQGQNERVLRSNEAEDTKDQNDRVLFGREVKGRNDQNERVQVEGWDSQPQLKVDGTDASEGEEHREAMYLNPTKGSEADGNDEFPINVQRIVSESGAPPEFEIGDSPNLDDLEENLKGVGALQILAGFSPLQLDDLNDLVNDDDRQGKGDDGALVNLPAFPPPLLARTCSSLTYNLSSEGLQSLSTDVNVELPEVRKFSYEELRMATNDFAHRNVVGTGGASSVYKAKLSGLGWMAVKRLVDNMAGEKEFMMEMMMLICTLNHPNLVTMIGFCAEGPHRLIAYKLLGRGSLERNLHNVSHSRKLKWEQRQKVACGASRGLAYLHSFSPKPIIHRDIKTSNILLSDDFEAQVSDFGLARWLSECDATDDQVSCAGTFGYLAPESLMYGGFNERTDVFAFGVVLLELISGRRPMEERLPDAQQSLVLWARTLQQNGKTHCLVDRGLKDINPQQFKRMMYAAFLCVQVSPEDRPTMDRVVMLLDPSCNYSPAILQPEISAPPFISMPELDGSRHLTFPLAMPSIPAE